MEPINIFSELYTEFIALPKPIHSYLYKIRLYDKEEVISNILKFFLDPNENHKFNDAFLKALVECYATYDDQYQFDGCISLDSIDLVREEVTVHRKRIDILIKTSDTIIAIENKIESRLKNPLDDYIEHVLTDSRKNKIFIILSIIPISKEEIRHYKNRNENYTFHNILYRDFIDKAKKNVLNRLEFVDNKYFVFFSDFIETINYFYHLGGEMENFEFFLRNFKKLEELTKSYDNFRKNDFGYEINRYLRNIPDKLNGRDKFNALGEWSFDEARSGKNSWVTFTASQYYDDGIGFRCLEISFQNLFTEMTFRVQISTALRYNRKKFKEKLNDDLVQYIRSEKLESEFKNEIILSNMDNHVLLIKDYKFEKINFHKFEKSIFDIIIDDWEPNLEVIKKILDYAKECLLKKSYV